MNDIRYIELIKACGLYGNDHLGDMLELCYQVAADERSKLQAVKGEPFDRPPTIDHGPCPWDICTGDCQWDPKGENQCPYK